MEPSPPQKVIGVPADMPHKTHAAILDVFYRVPTKNKKT